MDKIKELIGITKEANNEIEVAIDRLVYAEQLMAKAEESVLQADKNELTKDNELFELYQLEIMKTVSYLETVKALVS